MFEKHIKQQKTITLPTINQKKSAVINCIGRVPTDDEKSILENGFNYALVSLKIPKKDIISNIGNLLWKLPDHQKKIIRQDSCKIIRKRKAPKPNYTKVKILAANKLKEDNKVIIIRADKENATVIMNIEEYEKKILEE